MNGRIKGRRGARLAAITSGGAIPDTADYDVIEEPAETFVGRLNEDFAIESLAGDIFLLGNRSWRIRRVESGKVRVEDAHGAPPNIPFWFGEAPSRTKELSEAVSNLREEITGRIRKSADGKSAARWLIKECGLDEDGAGQAVAYVRDTLAVLGTVPTAREIVAERFFDESGGMQLVLHTPFGGRINRAWGLALRKNFCLNFDFELQAAATDDGIVLSLLEQHSFPLESIFGFVRASRLKKDLTQATLQSPMFTNRWRWNATRALAVLRHNGGKKVPMAIQRMRAEDLLGAVFPDQLGCQDNHSGPITPPDHPLVNETLDNCLREAMDIEGLESILNQIERGEIRTTVRETPAPSPMSHEILNANPYAFLDDAPLEERRARAVSLRRVVPELEDGIGALDPEAIREARSQAWPDVRDPDELHDVLLSWIILPASEAADWTEFAEQLKTAGRAAAVRWTSPDGGFARWIRRDRTDGDSARSDFRIGHPGATAGRGPHGNGRRRRRGGRGVPENRSRMDGVCRTDHHRAACRPPGIGRDLRQDCHGRPGGPGHRAPGTLLPRSPGRRHRMVRPTVAVPDPQNDPGQAPQRD